MSDPDRRTSARRFAIRLMGALVLTLFFGQAGAAVVAEIWLVGWFHGA